MALVDWKSGQAMILTLFVLLLLLLLGEAVLLAGISVQRNALLATRQKQAYYIAEAGINQAIAMIAAGRNDIAASLLNEPYAGGIVSAASCSGPVQDVYTVSCTGEYPGSGDRPESGAGYFSSCTVTAQFKLNKPAVPGSDQEQDAAGNVTMISWQ